MKSWHYDHSGLKPWEDRMLRDRDSEATAECYWCGNIFDESTLVVQDDVLVCPDCKIPDDEDY